MNEIVAKHDCADCGEEILFTYELGYCGRDPFAVSEEAEIVPEEVGEFVDPATGESVIAHAQCGLDRGWKLA